MNEIKPHTKALIKFLQKCIENPSFNHEAGSLSDKDEIEENEPDNDLSSFYFSLTDPDRVSFLITVEPFL